MVYLQYQYLGMPKISTKCNSIILLHITTDVLINLNDMFHTNVLLSCIILSKYKFLTCNNNNKLKIHNDLLNMVF